MLHCRYSLAKFDIELVDIAPWWKTIEALEEKLVGEEKGMKSRSKRLKVLCRLNLFILAIFHYTDTTIGY